MTKTCGHLVKMVPNSPAPDGTERLFALIKEGIPLVKGDNLHRSLG